MLRALILASCLSLPLGACTGFESFVKSANELDPDCGKDVRASAKFATVFVFGWPIPIMTEGTAEYAKKCSEKPPAPPTNAAPVINRRPLLGAAIPI